MEGVKRTNTVIVHPNQREVFAQYNPYAMEIDRGNRNCYNYKRFEHLVRNCRNREIENRIGKGRRLEYGQRLAMEGNNGQCNLNGKGDLVVLD